MSAILTLRAKGRCDKVPQKIFLDQLAVDGGAVVLGRSKKCTVVVNPGCNSGGASNTISRRHIEISCGSVSGKRSSTDGVREFRFRDLGAMNGTFLNDRKCASGVLVHGDTLQLGGGAGLKEGDSLRDRDSGICYIFELAEHLGKSNSIPRVIFCLSRGKVKTPSASASTHHDGVARIESQRYAASIIEASTAAPTKPRARGEGDPDLRFSAATGGANADEMNLPPALSTSAVAAIKQYLHCSLCSEILLDARLMPCSHAFCRLCYIQYMQAKGDNDAARSMTEGAPESVEHPTTPFSFFRAGCDGSGRQSSPRLSSVGHRDISEVGADPSTVNDFSEKIPRLKVIPTTSDGSLAEKLRPRSEIRTCASCPVCRHPVPLSWMACGSMHLENIIDIVVESLLPAEQVHFQLRRLHAKERLMTSLVLHSAEKYCSEDDGRKSLKGADANASLQATPSLSSPGLSVAPKRGDVPGGGRNTIKRKHACENIEIESSARLKRTELLCEGCNERGHTLEECPHRDSASSEAGSGDDADDGAMSGGDY